MQNLLVFHRYMVDIFKWLIFFKNPNCASPELRLGITGNRRFSGSCNVIATVRGPFRCAQEDKIKNNNDEYNFIRLTVSFLSRSTQESGFQTKNEEKRPERKAIK